VNGSQQTLPHFDDGGSQQTGSAQHPAALPREQYGFSGGQQPSEPLMSHTSPAPSAQQRCVVASRQTGSLPPQQEARPGCDVSPHTSPGPAKQYAPVAGLTQR
jgi:hypothetical protein